MERIILSSPAMTVARELASMPGFVKGASAIVSNWELSLLTELTERACSEALTELVEAGAIAKVKSGHRHVVEIVPTSWVWVAIRERQASA